MARVEGVPELTAALLRLPADVEKRVLRKSALAGARITRDAVKALAPIAARSSRPGVPPGTLRRAVVVKFAKELSGRGKSSYVVTLRRGKSQQKRNRDAFYWLWVEQGHRVVGRSGRVIGSAPPHPFFLPAYRATREQAVNAMRTALEKNLTDVINSPSKG